MFHEISEVDMLLKQWLESADFELSLMAKRMKEKYDKYWGSTEKMNMILYYAVIFDPRDKLEFVEFSFDRMYGSVGKNETMKEQVRLGLYELFDNYKLRHSNKLSDTSKSLCSSSNSSTLGSQDMCKKRLCEEDDESEMAIRLSLKQEFKMYKSGGKVRFPILSRMIQDILAVPISTVASEAAFSTGGRVLDAFRSSLSPKIVQSLICAQDWFRCDSKPINMEEDLCDVEMIEKELTKLGVDTYIIDV
ncbi:zinc finger BED domain-containing protein DAYSLEEPER-like [Primulina huaijiensis]|uniref:zinc finger BED domain-containing protein DAYSLEEPER-like n=1 Tax=Primulina huaijiensis TaxID=1492673 RepID=UPI003CC72586